MILLVGVSGAGKGTQGRLLAERFGYVHLESGEMVRTYATEPQRERMLAGKWLDDNEVINLVSTALKEQVDANNVVMDGFPRTISQAEWLLGDACKTYDLTIEAIIHFVVPVETVIARLSRRGRIDDSVDAILTRIHEHQQATEPMVAFFREKNLPVLDLDGAGSPDEVYQRILVSLNHTSVAKEK